MKKYLFFLILFLSILTLPYQSSAQETFANFEVLNRVLLVNYAESIDQNVKMEILKLYKGMRKKVDGLEWVHVADLKESSQGFDQAITFTFASLAGYELFEKHPDHKRIQELSSGNIKDVESYEYWEKIE